MHNPRITTVMPRPSSTWELRPRMARMLLADWVAEGWLVVADPSRKARKYGLVEELRGYLSSGSRQVTAQ